MSQQQSNNRLARLYKALLSDQRKTLFNTLLTSVALLCLLSFNPSYAQLPPNALSTSQQDFLDAYDAIKKNDRATIAYYKSKLEHYSLYPYILYHDYRTNMAETPPYLIEGFIKANHDNYLGSALYNRWLGHLAANQNWKAFLTAYKPQNSQDLQCYFIQAQAENNQLDIALKQATAIWQNTTQLSSACQPLEKLLKTHNKLSNNMLWHRINLLMNKKQTKNALQLAKELPVKDQDMLDTWLEIYKFPQIIANPLPDNIHPHVKNFIFTQGVRYLASKDPELAKKTLDQYFKKYGLTTAQYNDLNQKIALRTAYNYAPQAKAFLQNVNINGAKTEDTLRWQAQIALKNSDWLSLLETIELMDNEQQQEKQWQYWKARALEATKQTAAAKTLFEALSKGRNFYAFLSADRLNINYNFNPKPLDKTPTDQLLKKYPELTRIKELMAIGWALSSKREWYHLLNKANSNDLQAVAVLANQWEQHSQAISALAKAKNWDALNIRFPTPHKGPVMQNAEKNKIDPAWVYGIMRRESAFSVDIQSSSGAVGLMQLMPKTAKYVSKKIDAKNISYKKLTSAENNIELGSAYLSYLYKKYDGNRALATAAYNAGPSRVDSWIPENQTIAPDQWIDSIPFTETRNYVKAVMEYTTIFKSLLHQKYDRLRDVMPLIGNQPIQKVDSEHP